MLKEVDILPINSRIILDDIIEKIDNNFKSGEKIYIEFINKFIDDLTNIAFLFLGYDEILEQINILINTLKNLVDSKPINWNTFFVVRDKLKTLSDKIN